MTEKISGKSIIQDYIEDSDLTGEVNESLLLRWIMDYDNMVGMVEDLVPQIVHLYVDGYKADIPDGLKKVQQVVARKKQDLTCSRQETVSSWVTKTQYPDCDCNVTLECAQCTASGREKCGCDVPIYEVPIDRQWEISNPQHYLKGWSRMGIIGRGKGMENVENNEWTLLRPALDDFYKQKYFLNDCLSFLPGAVVHNSFRFEPPVITTDFPEGEIIISYLGKALDPDGDVMVSTDAHYLEGLIAHLDYKWWARESKRHAYSGKTNMRLFKQYSNQAKQEREASIRMYKARNVVPDYKEWTNFMEKVFLHSIPNRHFDRGMKRGLNTEIFKKYTNLLNAGDRRDKYENNRLNG